MPSVIFFVLIMVGQVVIRAIFDRYGLLCSEFQPRSIPPLFGILIIFFGLCFTLKHWIYLVVKSQYGPNPQFRVKTDDKL
jgi:uncharacterized membrane protein YdcZ (DUF606 family)